jgi:hypothetical protein
MLVKPLEGSTAGQILYPPFPPIKHLSIFSLPRESNFRFPNQHSLINQTPIGQKKSLSIPSNPHFLENSSNFDKKNSKALEKLIARKTKLSIKPVMVVDSKQLKLEISESKLKLANLSYLSSN